jgi:capsular exopolysaccharide synthesis family protein
LDGAEIFDADLLSARSSLAGSAGGSRADVQAESSLDLESGTRRLPKFAPASASYAAYTSSALLEAFRMLYGNLRFLSSDTPVRSLAIGSAVPADGKSTVSVFLGRVAASMGQRVLMVDADMRRPRMHQRLGLPNLRGLSNVLANDLEPAQAIQMAEPNLSVLTAGQVPPDPTRLLSSQRMQRLAEEFAENFDLVIYDTPPLLGLADGSLLGAYLDGILLVVGLGKTDRSAVLATIENLDVSCVPILGVVANGLRADTDSVDYYYRYYQRYYYQPNSQETATASVES